MATNVNFNTATYATSWMLPDADEEVTADWARKIMMNTARAAGYWGTLIATNTTVATVGTGFIYFTGFNFIPSVDIWHYEFRAGTLPDRYVQWSDMYAPASESNNVGKLLTYTFASGTGTIKLTVQPHPHSNDIGPELVNFNQTEHGTWIYRLRGI